MASTPRSFCKIVNGERFLYDCLRDRILQDNLADIADYSSYDRTQTSTIVDSCIEITTSCNLTCQNCFSSSTAGDVGKILTAEQVYEFAQNAAPNLVRLCCTGGEPMLHPQIDQILRLPEVLPELAFVLSTNGTTGNKHDDLIIGNRWLTAISLHGTERHHNEYTMSNTYQQIFARIASLARYTGVHIYCVISEKTTPEDVAEILKVRDSTGASFARFIVPRAFGRFRLIPAIPSFVSGMLDDRSGIKTSSSKTLLLSADSTIRMTN